ncbi:HAD-IA family hydrolase [Bartonella sp. HY038]|uniref:HAD-IA family hydrolase n=1 Tax=Bartonella sp. HY038 TaxID=2759660 RepID=UPI0015FBB6F3|nr:HAD-IA family hydrolase [Bartonella sp. HY038]
MAKPIIIFDLDGTLAQTAIDLLDSLNFCLQEKGYKTADLDDLHQFLGQGGRVMIQRALSEQNIAFDDAMLDEMVAIFLKHYKAHIPGKTTYFPGAREAVKRFEDAGFLTAICTNKFEEAAKRIINAIDPQNHYSAICGGDSFAWRKPDGRHILSTIEAAAGDPKHAVMIGDSAADINAAKSAGIPVIAVDFGYTNVPVSQLAPNHIISHFDKLIPELVNSILASQ